jgi:hypothetical protein
MQFEGMAMRLLLAAAILALGAPTSWAQDKEEKKKPKDRGDAPAGKDEKKGKAPCGKGPHEIAEEMKKNGLGGDDLDESVAKHFKAKHPDGPCHCTCGHEGEDGAGRPKPPPKEGDAPAPRAKQPPKDGDACGRTVKQILGEPRVDENKVAEHFKRHHPKGEACHCSCGHDAPPRKGEKGNNGVGNGEDPQPPGKAPVNDGPGDKPGAPGRKGGEKR